MEFGKEYIKTFETEAQYTAFKASSGYNEPNVSYISEDNLVHYNPLPPYSGFCKLTLNNGETVELEGSGVLTSAMTSSYKSTLVRAEIGALCTEIGYEAFSEFSGLTRCTIGSSVGYIDNLAFYGCESLTSITIPNSVIKILKGAFQYCSSLTRIVIPSDSVYIDDAVFYGCSSLTSIVMPSDFVYIGDATFEGCSSLTSIVMPSGAEHIGDDAFQGCSSLTSITIPSGVTSIGMSTFGNCSSLTSIDIPDSVTIIGSWAFSYCYSLTSCTIGNGVTSIGYFAFGECSGLTRCTIGSSVTSISEEAFSLCTSLASIAIPSGVTSIGDYAFAGCSSSLTSITVDSNNAVYNSRNNCNAIIETSTNALILGCINTVIPSSVTSIGDSAFGGCSGLTSIDIPNGVTSIGDYAFSDCSSLTGITVNATTPPTLGEDVFYDINNFTIYVPSGSLNAYKTAWSDYADRILTKSQLAFIPVEDSTFGFSKSGLSYSLDNGNTWTALAANGTTPTVSAGSKILWKNNTAITPSSSDGIGKFISTGRFTVEGNIMSLLYGDNFVGQTDLTGYNYAFRSLFSGCTRMTSAENMLLPATTLASRCYDSMFRGCTSLTTAPGLPATTLADYCYNSMFVFCTSLTTAPELPATTLVDSCYNNMFYGCESLTTAPELPATTLADSCYYHMFQNCSRLNSITCLATDISAQNCTSDWVLDIASRGTFTKAASMSDWTTGDNGIPNGWTVQNA